MRCHEQHRTNKPTTSPTYDAKWSGVTHGAKCRKGNCLTCGGCLHHEGHDSHYCPRCDDYRHAPTACTHS